MTKFDISDASFAPIRIKPKRVNSDPNNNEREDATSYQPDNSYGEKHPDLQDNDKMRQRKTTICCLLQKSDSGSYTFAGCTVANKATIFRFVGLCLLTIVILCCVYGLKYGRGSHKSHRR